MVLLKATNARMLLALCKKKQGFSEQLVHCYIIKERNSGYGNENLYKDGR